MPAATPREDRSTPAGPPRVLLWVSGLAVAAGVAMAVVGAVKVGVSWDEPYHVMRLRNFLDHGWFAVDWSVADGGDGGSGESNTLVYGPVAMLLLHALGALVGTEGWGSIATTPEAYAVRHLGVVAIGLVGTAAAAATTRVLLGSWRWALVTAGALMALPMWTGHLMFNIKDVPVATGYALVTLALVAMVGIVGQGHRGAWWRVGCLFAGTVLAVGTRPAMLSAVVGGVVLLVAGSLLTRRPVGPALREVGLALGAAAALLVAVYPGVYGDPLRLLASARQAANFRTEDPPGRLYVPFHLVAEFPLLLQAGALLGLVLAVRTVLRWRTDGDQAVRLALVVAQVAALPLVAVVKDSSLYNGLRQLLFAAPAWAVLVTLGLAAVLAWSRRPERTRPRATAALAAAAASVAVLAPLADQATLFPYQYTYWNAALDATGVHVSTDYWRTSVPALLDDVPTNGQVVCSPTRATTSGDLAGSPGAEGVDQTAMVAGRYSGDSSVDCRTDALGPLAPLWAADDLPVDDALPADEFYVIIDRDHAVPSNCTQLDAVTRDRHFRTVTMTYVARCRLAPPELVEPVAFDRPVATPLTPQQWAFAPEGWVARDTDSAIDAEGPAASLTFTVPGGCAGCDLELDAGLPDPDELTATVDGEPAAVRVAYRSVHVALPPDVVDPVVTFSRSTGADLDLRVRSLRLRPSDPSGSSDRREDTP